MAGWIAVDLDGILAKYDGWHGPEVIGEPIVPMLERVRQWVADGKDVRIFTARVAHDHDNSARSAIYQWLIQHLGYALPVTNQKDYGMIELWGDRCVQVEFNTGIPVDPTRR